jgi:hypothetical protein
MNHSLGGKAGAQKETQTELFDGFEIVTYVPDGYSLPVPNFTFPSETHIAWR